MIPYGRQDISEDDLAAVVEVLQSDYLTQGPVGARFEGAVASRCNAQHAVTANSATSALHIACLAVELGPGDLLWTVPNTFIASANVGIYCGADVDFVDIEPDTYCMSVDALEQKLARAEAEGRLPKILIPVHFAGQSCNMMAIAALARARGIKIIEDASHAIGARYLGEPVGNCAYSDICVFSFHPVKIITCAEGGMALTNDAQLAQRISLLRSHGVTREESQLENPSEGGWYYEMLDLGFNYRMTEMQSALGLSQLGRIDEFIARRHALARRYDAALATLDIDLPAQSADSYSALHLYPIQVDERSGVFANLRAAGINVNVHYIPVHTQPFWRKRGFDLGDFPVAEAYYSRAISIPLFPRLSDAQQDEVVKKLRAAIAG